VLVGQVGSDMLSVKVRATGRVDGLAIDLTCMRNVKKLTGPGRTSSSTPWRGHGVIVGRAHATRAWGECGEDFTSFLPAGLSRHQ
jgi:hypothetical protein